MTKKRFTNHFDIRDFAGIFYSLLSNSLEMIFFSVGKIINRQCSTKFNIAIGKHLTTLIT
jgi:hypothetical protein